MSVASSARSTFASPPMLSRNFSLTSQASSVSSAGAGPSSVGGSDKKKRTRTLLRDYYGLAGTADAGTKKGDPMDMDSPASFNPDLYFDSLAATASLPDLLRKENELTNEIRELDGERQSLVYNHHSELIDASETIKKMKSRALALDASLDSLKTSFQSISQLSTALASPSSTPATLDPTGSHKTPPRRPLASQTTPSHAKRLSTLLETPTSSGTHVPAPLAEVVFDPLLHLPMLLSLPLLLRHSDKKAELWGQWEPALRSWEEEGIMGVKEVGNECREALREVRRNSVSSRGGLVD